MISHVSINVAEYLRLLPGPPLGVSHVGVPLREEGE